MSKYCRATTNNLRTFKPLSLYNTLITYNMIMTKKQIWIINNNKNNKDNAKSKADASRLPEVHGGDVLGPRALDVPPLRLRLDLRSRCGEPPERHPR